jgi:hypothetical protein
LAEFRHKGILLICISLFGLIMFITLNVKYFNEQYPEKGFILNDWIFFIVIYLVLFFCFYLSILIRKNEKKFYNKKH